MWVVETEDEELIGPFDSEDQAYAFAAILPGTKHIKEVTDPRDA